MDKNKCNSCGEAKCSCKNKDFTKAVIQIDNPEQITLMRKVVIPASMGDDTTVPPAIGKYHNVLLNYEANNKSYLYSSDGIPTLLTGAQGEQGPAGTVTVGTTTTGEPGSSASVENVGTPENAVLNFTVPQGPRVPEEEVQEDVDNKLDEMVEDGTFDTIINDEIFGEIQEEIAKNKKYKSQVTMICDHGSQGDCYIVQFANGKNMFIDTGMESAWSHIYLTISNMGITKFDYGIITHPHGDHAGNVQNFIDNFDVSDCTWYIGKVPDLTQIENERTRYENFLTLLQTNDITPIQPTNNSTVTIDELSKTSMRFLNTDPEWFDDYYYPNAVAEYNTDVQTANVFSLVTEITFDNVKFLSVGDIEKCVEDKLVGYIGKVDICTAPHHFDNKHGNKQFWDDISPDTIFLNTPNGAIAYGNYDYQLATQANRYIINSYYTTPDTVTATTYGYNFEYDAGTCKYLEYGHMYNNIGSLVSSVQVSGGYAGITLNTILNSMEDGDVLITSTLTGYTQLLSDLSTVFGIPVEGGATLKITRHYENEYEIVITGYAKRLTFEANKFGNNYYIKGYGIAGSWSNETELLTLINSLTAGTYEVQYNGNADHALGSVAGYMTLHITNITSTGYRKGYLEGVRNNTNFTIWFGNFTGVAGGFSWKIIPWS